MSQSQSHRPHASDIALLKKRLATHGTVVGEHSGAIADLLKRVRILEGEREKSNEAAECLVRCLYLYNGHRTDSRGPLGCIMDALKIIAPDVHDDVVKTSAEAVYRLRWSER